MNRMGSVREKIGYLSEMFYAEPEIRETVGKVAYEVMICNMKNPEPSQRGIRQLAGTYFWLASAITGRRITTREIAELFNFTQAGLQACIYHLLAGDKEMQQILRNYFLLYKPNLDNTPKLREVLQIEEIHREMKRERRI